MKIFHLTISLILVSIFMSSCSKNDDADFDGKLTGKWDVTKVEGQQYVNGNEGIYLTDSNPTGYIQFDSNGKGKQNYSFTLFGTTYPQYASFSYTSTASKININRYNDTDLEWDRLVNLSSKQVASYDIIVDANTTIKYTLTLEK